MQAPIRTFLASRLVQFAAREDGQALIEYALIVVIVSIAAIAALTQMGGTVTNYFSNVAADF